MEPSRTALMAAAARAAHPIVDRPPFVFEDTLAAALLGDRADELIDYHRRHGGHPILRHVRAQATVRARFTEDLLAASGADQYVILGAGLDSYAHRVTAPGRRVFELDRPSTQDWKRARAAALPVLTPVTYVPIDFEADSVTASLRAAGFDPSRPAVVGWLGVTMYLTRDAVAATLADLGSLAPGSSVVFDHMLPEGARDADGQSYVEQVAPATPGEPWLTFLDLDDAAALARAAGFPLVDGFAARDAVPPGLWRRDDSLVPSGLAVLTRAAK
jgi:methyltransferase (TIGR00027 family)